MTCWKASFAVEGAPVKHRLHYQSPEIKKALEEHLESMLSKGVVRPSRSPWGARPVFVGKKNGSKRLCFDYRDLNKKMVPDSYPLPLLWPLLQEVAGHKWYVTLDLNWGFWNVPLEEESKQYTAVITHKGTFEFNVIPFGIRNSPGEFQRAMDIIFSDLYPRNVRCYIDDIVIFGNTKGEVLVLLEDVLRRVESSGVFLKMPKCEWLQQEILLLGHVVSVHGILPNPEKVSAIRDAVPPTDKSELRPFLGLASFLRKFVPHFAQTVAPLVDLTSPKVPFKWTEVENDSFELLKSEITNYVLLSVPDEQGEFLVFTDASSRGIGCVLMQIQHGEPVYLEFASRKFTPAERKWDTREREAFAVVWAVKRFRWYIASRKTLVFTDHESLRWKSGCESGKVQRWALFLSQFNLEIRHINGDLNAAADWLSRAWKVDDAEFDDAMVDEMSVPVLTAVSAKPEAEKVSEFVPSLPSASLFLKALALEPKENLVGTFRAESGYRYHERSGKLYVPEPLRDRVLWWFHTSLLRHMSFVHE